MRYSFGKNMAFDSRGERREDSDESVLGFYAESESSADMENLTYKMIDWCEEAFGAEYDRWRVRTNHSTIIMTIKNPQDAMLFKLSWSETD